MDFAGKSSRETDHRILKTIVASIDAGEAPTPLVEAKQDFLRLLCLCETEEYSGELWEYLMDHPKLTRISVIPTAWSILETIQNELAKHTAIERERPLTEEELRYGREELLPLLNRVHSLIQWAGGEEQCADDVAQELGPWES